MDTNVLGPDKLNTFFARFEDNSVPPTWPATKKCGLSFSVDDVSMTFKLANPRKVADPDGIPSHVLRACAAGWCVYGHIQSLPIPVYCPHMLQDGHHCSCTQEGKDNWTKWLLPLALTSVIMNCFERLTSYPRLISVCVMPQQVHRWRYRYRHHTALSHLDQRNTYVRMLCIDLSSAFNTIVPFKVIIKLEALGLNLALCNWVLDFLTGHPLVVKLGNNNILICIALEIRFMKSIPDQ